MSSAITLRALTGSKNCLQNGSQSEILAPLRGSETSEEQGFTVLTGTSDLGRPDGVSDVSSFEGGGKVLPEMGKRPFDEKAKSCVSRLLST